ncbi:MAG: hypothetical protein KF703_00820 [Actinobacteria bacterium]|nr:hypothetical protein [Actinomycetota bacterium]
MAQASAPPDTDEPMAMRWSIGRVLAVAISVSLVAFWIWIFSGAPARPNPDRLDDRAFVARAEARCERLLDDLGELPGPGDFGSAEGRADVLDQANAMVATMVDDLEADAPTTGDDAVRMEGWIADWRTYLADREDYARRLREDPDAKLLISVNEKLQDPVDKTIQIFADDVNEMPACATPGDVG